MRNRPAPLVLQVSTAQGSLDVLVNWDDTDGADSYLVRWREAGPGNALNDGVNVASSNAAITVAGYGEWVVRVEACNDAGCGLGAAKRFPDPTGSGANPRTHGYAGNLPPNPRRNRRPAFPSSPPACASPPSAASTDVSLDWDDVSDTDSYLVALAGSRRGRPAERRRKRIFVERRHYGCRLRPVGGAPGSLQRQPAAAVTWPRRFGVQPPANRAPVVDEQAANYDAFVGDAQRASGRPSSTSPSTDSSATPTATR